MPKHQIAVVLILESDDEALAPDAPMDMRTARDFARFRAAVLRSLPGSVARVVAAMPVPVSELMMAAHDEAMSEIGIPVIRPPGRYVPPTRD